jgi:hypothetical protein
MLQNINTVLGDNVDGDTKSSVNKVTGGIEGVLCWSGQVKARTQGLPRASVREQEAAKKGE